MAIKITEEQEQSIIKAYQNGSTYEQISEIEIVAISTISRIIKKYNVVYKCQCGMCKEMFIPKIRAQKFCDGCKYKATAEYQKEYRKKRREKYKAKPKIEQKSKVKSLDEVLRIIREQGITYAEYQLREG